MKDADETARLRELLSRARDEADEAWRDGCRTKRDNKLRLEIEALIGPTAWDALPPTTHIAWGDQAICYWTRHTVAQWPPTQTWVKITDLITQLPSEDDTYVEFVARPDSDWNGVTCDACRVRLPTLLREMSRALDDVHEGILEGHRTHPETIRAQALYMRDVEPKLTAEQRQRYAEQEQRNRARNARRAARRGAS